MCGRPPLGKEFDGALLSGSGSFMCTACCVRPQAAGHDDVGGSDPHQTAALWCALNHAGCSDRRLDRISITPVVLLCPTTEVLFFMPRWQRCDSSLAGP